MWCSSKLVFALPTLAGTGICLLVICTDTFCFLLFLHLCAAFLPLVRGMAPGGDVIEAPALSRQVKHHLKSAANSLWCKENDSVRENTDLIFSYGCVCMSKSCILTRLGLFSNCLVLWKMFPDRNNAGAGLFLLSFHQEEKHWAADKLLIRPMWGWRKHQFAEKKKKSFPACFVFLRNGLALIANSRISDVEQLKSELF